jgi:hypothetical protein
MHPNTMKHTKTRVWGPMGWIRCVRCEKLQHDFVARTYVLMHQFSMFCNKFHAVTKRSQMHPNTTKCTETIFLGPIGWIGSIRCEKSRRDFVAWTFALIALVHPVLHRVSCSYEMIPNAPRYYEGPMGWMGCVRCEKSRCYFVAWTFALIAPVHPILHQVSCSYEMIPNAPKHYETHQNMSLGPNGVDQLHLLGKITTWLRGTNFCINCTNSVCFAPSFMQLRNDPKCTQIHWNIPKHYFRVQLGGLGVSIAKNPDVTSWHELLH